MSQMNSLRALARYNRWMNESLYAHAAKLSDAQRKQDAGAFFKSIHGTLNHILLADRVWLGRLTGVHFAVKSLGDELHADFETLRAERAITDNAIIERMDLLTESELDATLTYKRITGDQTTSMPLRLVLTHFFNHQTHHRGQVTTLLSQQGIDPGVTDLIAMPEARSFFDND